MVANNVLFRSWKMVNKEYTTQEMLLSGEAHLKVLNFASRYTFGVSASEVWCRNCFGPKEAFLSRIVILVFFDGNNSYFET